MQELRDYQLAGWESVLDAFRQGARTVLAVAPTGSGKTTLFVHGLHQVVTAKRRGLILVHRRELATQACNRLREWSLDFGLIMAGEPTRPFAPVQVASVATLVRRAVPPADIIIADEAHLSTADTWRKVLEQYPRSRILGVTATPWRMSGKPLAGTYDACVVIATPSQLRAAGHLCGYVGFSYKTPDLSEVKTTAGDYNEAQSAAVMSQSVIVDNIVEEWGKHARDLSTIVFGVTVTHSRQLCDRFKAAGVVAEHLDGGTPKFQRDAILKRVASGATRVLCNVGVAVEGLDIPRLKCCIDACPSKSLTRVIQKYGRVRRPWQGVTARIHDHAFNIRLHGLPDDERDYTLTSKPEAPKEMHVCSECLAYYSRPPCPACDHTPAAESVEREINTIADAEQIEFSSSDAPAPADLPPVQVRWETPGREIAGIFRRTSTEQASWGPQRFYLVEGEKRSYSLPGTTDLDRKLAGVIPDSKVWITYVEATPLSNGRVKKRFKVEVDDDQPSAVST